MAVDKMHFLNMMAEMMQGFAAPKMDERLAGLYHFFKNEEYDVLEQAAEKCAFEQEKFPTPAVFRVYVHMAKKGQKLKAGTREEIECSFCRGGGVVHARRRVDNATHTDFAFRCHCPNATKFMGIPAWTTDCGVEFELVDTNVYQHLHDNPELYEKGVAYLSSELVGKDGMNFPNAARRRIVDRIRKAKEARDRHE